jgi:hypothetical protein
MLKSNIYISEKNSNWTHAHGLTLVHPLASFTEKGLILNNSNLFSY